ncbi:hypothetical protein J27TS8_16140 [Robertmurraya siralis]|uniref:Uncharacterized protein n=1 Tax=Robertmurraya siralis TaxID=77777 RepID=A0A919WH57_9BACI|nr:hypothetical protein [Robertmurraya siralis]PAE21478.1 hypothetical protein CHH80_06125 [Bacillus sp. 7504-2]GIN61621.1 hypothetical protein J27TS8_16140 [Robertmurraya siralis]
MKRKLYLSFILVIFAFICFSGGVGLAALELPYHDNTESKVEEKIALYKLNFIDDILEEGSNEVRYYWNDIKDNEQSVDLNIVVNSEAKIIFVEEKNINSKTEVEQIKKSIDMERFG